MKRKQWRYIPGYGGGYAVSDCGDVISFHNSGNGRTLKPHFSKGLVRVTLSRKNNVKAFSVSRLVASAFICELNDNMIVEHIDGKMKNNKVSNLRVVTRLQHAINCCQKGHIIKQRRLRHE